MSDEQRGSSGGNPFQVLYLFLGCCALAMGVWAGLQDPALDTLCANLLTFSAAVFVAAAWIHTRH